MMATSIPLVNSRALIWGVGVSFVLFQFFLQLSSGVVIGAIMHDMHLSALAAGLLGSSLYVIYTSLQIPVGILFDLKNTRILFAANAFICAIGCIVFASSYGLFGLFAGRFLIGTGSAFAFVGFSHLVRQHFPLKHFAFMIGLSETLGFIATVIGMISMGKMLSQWGWRGFLNVAGIVGFLIAFFCWKYIPNHKPDNTDAKINYARQILQILGNRTAWINGLFVGLSFIVVTVFGALWAVPFVQVKLGCSLAQASMIGSMVFLGAGVSCPLFGYLSNQFARRRPLILFSCVTTTILLLIALYWPIYSYKAMAILMFGIGMSCGAYMLAFAISNELAPANCLSTCTGFTNTLAVITAALLQPFTGFLLDFFNQHSTSGTALSNYQNAMLTIPISLMIASLLVFYLPEKENDADRQNQSEPLTN